MGEQLILQQDFQSLGEQLILVTGVCSVLILGTVFLLLLLSDRTRARGYELNSRCKLGHDTLQKETPNISFWKKILEL